MCLHDAKSTENNWILLATQFSNSLDMLSLLDHAHFSSVTSIIPNRSDVEEFNINKLRFLNSPIVRINAVYTGVGACKADSDVAKGLESFLLLLRGSRIMFRTNL